MLEAGAIINQRYQLQTKLGRNAGRQTWLAQDLQIKNQENTTNLVVVKLLAFGGDVQWEDLKLFEREAQILQQINHNRIPKYQDYFSIDDRNLWFGLIQEYIPGNSLKQLLDNGKRFSELEVRQIAQEILTILLYLHDFNPPLLHRDIKPSNLILGEDNHIYLVDFGAVQDRAATEGATFTVVGTYGYAPMEQFGGKAVFASDLYGLGATLIHLLTRTTPGDLPTVDLTIQFTDRVSLQPKFASWLTKITHPAVERRFKTAQEALKALEFIERKDTINLTQDKFAYNSLLFNKRIKIFNEPNYLDITIIKRGIKNLTDLTNIVGSSFLILISILLFIYAFPIGIITLIICYFAFYPYLEYLFANTKVIFNSQDFLIKKEMMFNISNARGKTFNIQDVSINYQAMKEQKIATANNLSAIVITTEKSEHNRGYQQYSFGKGLSEEEAIWIANEIRNWLSNQ